MRFKQYLITEQDGLEKQVKIVSDAAQQIIADCRPFLHSIQASHVHDVKKAMIYRGMGGSVDIHDVKRVRQKRDPVDMPQQVHEFLDQWFHQNFGYNVRSNGLFVSSGRNQASSYGHPFMIFPIGQFDLIASKQVRDLYEYLSKVVRNMQDQFPVRELRDLSSGKIRLSKKHLQLLQEALEEANYQHLSPSELMDNHEAVVICDSYHAISGSIDPHVEDQFFETLFKNM